MVLAKFGWIVGLAAALAYGETPPIQGSEALKGMAEDATALNALLVQTADRYSEVGEPVRVELSPRKAPAPYHNALFDLVVRNQDQEQVIDYTRWAQSLSQQLTSLDQDFRSGLSRSELQDRFFAVHVAYVRTLISSYVFLECAKRQYLYADARFLLSERTRPDLEDRLNQIHTRAHRLLRWMHYIRTARDLTSMTQSQYFKKGEVWEIQHGKSFHYLPKRPIARQGFANRSDLGRYFAPVTESKQDAAPVSPQLPQNPSQPSTDREALIRQWEALQKEFEKPENRNNTALREQLEDLQRKLEAPQLPQPPAQGNLGEDSAGSRNSANDPRLNQLTIKLQGLLASPAVRSNAELEKALLEFLKELNPDQAGPIKPLPPTEPEAPQEPESPSSDF